MGKPFDIKDGKGPVGANWQIGWGGSVTAAIREALREKLEATPKAQAKPWVEEAMAFLAELRGHWKPEFDGQELLITHGDLLYDEMGLPK